MRNIYLSATRKPSLVVLCREIHVVVGERSAARVRPQAAVLRAAQQRHGVAPHLALGARAVGRLWLAAAQPRAQVRQRHLLDERRAVLAEVPPLEYQDQARYQRRRAGQRHVELGRERAEECRRVPHHDAAGCRLAAGGLYSTLRRKDSFLL